MATAMDKWPAYARRWAVRRQVTYPQLLHYHQGRDPQTGNMIMTSSASSAVIAVHRCTGKLGLALTSSGFASAPWTIRAGSNLTPTFS